MKPTKSTDLLAPQLDYRAVPAKNRRSRISWDRYGLYFVIPFIVVLLMLKILPMLYAIGLSFVNWDGLGDKAFVGFRNYARLIRDANFYKAVFNTAFIWFLNIFFRMAVALVCAFIFAQSRLRGTQFFKAVFYFPNLVTASSIAVFAYLVLDYQSGFVNQILLDLRVINERINWLQTPFAAQASVGFIIWWMWFGYAAIFFTTGMLSIPRDIIESSIVDGANAWRRFWRIIMPLMRPTFAYVFITSLIGGMQNFEIPRLLTDGRGAPDKSLLTMVMQLYNLTFQNFQYGYGATYAVALFILIAAVTGFSFRVVQGDRNGVSEGGGAS
jgi:cellobiose transport system permease protein